jgi:putative PIN family toxin of toxin-antitoxin system
VVLDTNLVLSALIFGAGPIATLRTSWQRRQFIPLLSTTMARELIRVLAYEKFRLRAEEREHLLADYLPFCESVRVPNPPPKTPPCRDPFDVPFLELALAGNADYLVTGDRDLLGIAARLSCPIIDAKRFLTLLEST